MSKQRKSAMQPRPMQRKHAARIDIGATSIYVAVPVDRDPQPVQSFQTFTEDLHRLADWLQRCRIKTVAMESTGVFWVPLFQILELRGFEVCLVNAHHVKNVPGRKTDLPIASGCNTCIQSGCCRLLFGRHSKSALCVPSCAIATASCKPRARMPSECRRRSIR